MSTEFSDSLSGYPDSKLLRTLDNDWCEYATAGGRKIYYNKKTNKISWKPPRKVKLKDEKDGKKSSTWSLPPTEDSVGTILKEGVLLLAKLWQDNIVLKKKWHKYEVVLTDSYFVFVRNKKNRGDQIRRVALTSATLRKEHHMTKKKNAMCLTSKTATMLLYCEDPIEADAWFAAITTVIYNLSKPRPKSLNLNYTNDMFNFGQAAAPNFAIPTNMYEVTDSVDNLSFQSPYRRQSLGTNSSLNSLSLPRNIIDINIDSPKHSIKENQVLNSMDKEMSVNRLKILFDELPPNFKYPTPPGWVAQYNDDLRRYVYYNLRTGQVWSVAKRENGGVYFFDTESFATSLLLPSDNLIRKSFRKETSI